jgi:omega-hydroxy-beta-dihydromenaquinone-9 sulfotransferase
VTKPLFLLGQPRSGTTRFEEILSEDKESLMALTLFEMRYPYLTVQYAFDGLAWLDRTLLRGALRHVAFDVLHLNKPFGGKGARAQMRRLQYELSDEDDIVFLFHQLHHFQLIGAAPDDEFIRLFYHFDHLPEASQRRALSFHRQCVQKALYRRGHGRTYFAKWVAGWNGQLDAARSLYPDAQYIVIVRDPAESVPSWLKLQGLLAADLTGENMMDRPHLHHAFKEENIAWFHNEIRFCRSIASQNITILDSDQFYRDIQGDVRKVYEHLGRPIKPGSEFDLFLARTQAKQEAHRKTKTDESHLTQAEIRNEFPDLFKEIMAIPGMHSVHAGLTPASARPSPMPSPAPESPARGW